MLDIPTLVMERYGLIAKKHGKEYHSPCPDCAGRDRMIWFDDDKGNGFCRQCLKTFWLTDLEKLDPLEKLERIQRAREIQEREQKLQAARLTAWQSKESAYRQGWHDAMSFAARLWWNEQGISDDSIDWYGLGACKYPLVNGRTGERINLTAYTIPIRDPESWEVVNMQYRLDNPPAGMGKYRQENGLPARSFYARQHTGGDCLIVEGAKKAIVLDQLLGGGVQVIGLPGITPSETLIDEMACYKRKWLIPDPGVSETVIRRFGERLENLRVVHLQVKPDDAILQHHFTRDNLRDYLRFVRIYQ